MCMHINISELIYTPLNLSDVTTSMTLWMNNAYTYSNNIKYFVFSSCSPSSSPKSILFLHWIVKFLVYYVYDILQNLTLFVFKGILFTPEIAANILRSFFYFIKIISYRFQFKVIRRGDKKLIWHHNPYQGIWITATTIFVYLLSQNRKVNWYKYVFWFSLWVILGFSHRPFCL